MTASLLYLLVLLGVCTVLEAYVWSRVLGYPMPLGPKAYEDLPSHPGNVEPLPAYSRPRGLLANRTKRHWTPCSSDRQCGRGHFCDKHYGTCGPHRNHGDPCRRSRQCKKGMECVFGRCRDTIRFPNQGAMCKNDQDCGMSQCCARMHGNYVCKPHLRSGERCYVPRGGLSYSLNELCPCEQGFICADISNITQETTDEDSSWPNLDNLRCVRP